MARNKFIERETIPGSGLQPSELREIKPAALKSQIWLYHARFIARTESLR